MKKLLIVLGIVLVLGIAALGFGSRGLSEIKNMAINEVNLLEVSDGVYSGAFNKVRWAYEVEVTVQNHKIASITNLTAGAAQDKIANQAIEAIIAGQTVKIDVISGATVNTKAFQKAVEDALKKGIK